MKYVQPYDQPSNPVAPYVDLNAQSGTDGSIVPAKFLNNVQAEILNVILAANLTPSDANLAQLLAAIRSFIPAPVGGPSDSSLVHWGVDSGSVNALVVVSPSPSAMAVSAGFEINIIPGNTVTGASQLTVGLAPTGSFTAAITGPDGTPLVAGAIKTGILASFVYDGSTFRLTASSAGAALLPQLWVIQTSGLWTKTPGSRKMLAFLTGGGASGGGGQLNYNGQGGGPGVTAISMIDTTIVTSATITIGPGGAAVGASSPGNDGGTSVFGPTVGAFYTMSAPGGIGGATGAARGPNSGASQYGGQGQFILPGAPGDPRTGGDQAGNGGSSFWGGGGLYASDTGGIAPASGGQNGGGGGGGGDAAGNRTSGPGGQGLFVGVEF